MSRATVTTFGRGVSFVASGETGTQANEFEAAIKSVTSSTTVDAVFLYDTRNDSDGGAWRKKCRGLSWFDETLNTATRGGRREFPSVALLVADNATGAGGLTVYDLDDPSIPMFMVFSKSGTSVNSQSLCSTDDQISCVYALNGRIYFGVPSGGDYHGLRQCDLTTDRYSIYNTEGERVSTSSDRNAVHDWMAISANADKTIASNTVNDVAAKIVEGSEIGALGLPIPTIACALANKISVIHSNGTVVDLSDSASAGRVFENVAWRDDGSVVGYNSANGAYQSFRIGSIYADTNTNDFRYENGSATNIPNPITNAVSTSIAHGNGKLYGGNSAGLTIFNENKGNPAESLFAYINSAYNTGYMLGDIRGAWLANLTNLDRSVKGNILHVNNTSGSDYVEEVAVATNAELKAYTNFKAGNYLSRAADTDFDFGTGDFSIMFWVKFSENSVYDLLLSREYHNGSAYSGNGFQIDTGGNNAISLKNSAGTGMSQITGDSVFGQWRQIIFTRRSGNFYAYRDGVLIDGPDANTTDFDNSNATLEIGKRVGSTVTVADKSSLSLLRLSATAPTPQQVKEMYEAEKPLFRAGAKCLLAANQVNDLAYDSSTNLLHVASESTSSSKSFRGLEAVESLTSDGSLGLTAATAVDGIAAAGGVLAAYDSAKVGVNLPAIDVRGDLNTADTKLPDDGKLHFSGVTTDATVTTIGQIPVAEGEALTVEVLVQGSAYNDAASGYTGRYVIKQGYYRALGASSPTTARDTMSKLAEEGSNALDATLEADTTAQTVKIKVTGTASVPRMVWTATAKVVRQSEKQYER